MAYFESSDERSANYRATLIYQAPLPDLVTQSRDTLISGGSSTEAQRNADVVALQAEDPFRDDFELAPSLKSHNSINTLSSNGPVLPPMAHIAKKDKSQAKLRAARRAYINKFEDPGGSRPPVHQNSPPPACRRSCRLCKWMCPRFISFRNLSLPRFKHFLGMLFVFFLANTIIATTLTITDALHNLESPPSYISWLIISGLGLIGCSFWILSIWYRYTKKQRKAPWTRRHSDRWRRSRSIDAQFVQGPTLDDIVEMDEMGLRRGIPIRDSQIVSPQPGVYRLPRFNFRWSFASLASQGNRQSVDVTTRPRLSLFGFRNLGQEKDPSKRRSVRDGIRDSLEAFRGSVQPGIGELEGKEIGERRRLSNFQATVREAEEIEEDDLQAKRSNEFKQWHEERGLHAAGISARKDTEDPDLEDNDVSDLELDLGAKATSEEFVVGEVSDEEKSVVGVQGDSGVKDSALVNDESHQNHASIIEEPSTDHFEVGVLVDPRGKGKSIRGDNSDKGSSTPEKTDTKNADREDGNPANNSDNHSRREKEDIDAIVGVEEKSNKN